MHVILGFGETEKRYEERLENSLRDNIVENYAACSDLFFSDEFIEEAKRYVQEAAKNSQEAADRYKDAAEYPDRYSRFWGHVVADCSYIVVILHIHHINRRHALSPDGWGLLQSERVFFIRESDIGRDKKAA